jgi:hypothetical protein
VPEIQSILSSVFHSGGEGFADKAVEIAIGLIGKGAVGKVPRSYGHSHAGKDVDMAKKLLNLILKLTIKGGKHD